MYIRNMGPRIGPEMGSEIGPQIGSWKRTYFGHLRIMDSRYLDTSSGSHPQHVTDGYLWRNAKRVPESSEGPEPCLDPRDPDIEGSRDGPDVLQTR